MKYIILISLAIIVLLLIAVTIFIKLYKKTKASYEEEHLQLINLQEEYSKLAEAYKIKKENKEKADEKINNLHSGDSVANAINILRK